MADGGMYKPYAIISQAMFDAEVRLSVTLQRVRLKSGPFFNFLLANLVVTGIVIIFASVNKL